MRAHPIDSEEQYHRPIFVKEVLTNLGVEDGKRYIDATLGDAGHSLAIAQHGGTTLGIDWDSDAIKRAKSRLEGEDNNVAGRIRVHQGSYTQIDQIAISNDFVNVDGILFDLGVSTYQLLTPSRGFSIYRQGPLDMRMNQSLDSDVGRVLHSFSEGELYEIFTRFSQEHNSRTIARAIVRTRSIGKSIKTTIELASLIEKVSGKGGSRLHHPATRIFQALRIFVNRELENIKIALPKAVKLLRVGGRIGIISYHSLEDRIVKLYFHKEPHLINITKKPIRPSDTEVKNNSRARSAKLRVAEKI